MSAASESAPPSKDERHGFGRTLLALAWRTDSQVLSSPRVESVMMMNEHKQKENICEIGRRLYAKGFAAANDGNITVRLNER